MIQKILIAFVTLTLAACLLTGCGKKDDDSNTATTDTATQAAAVTAEKVTEAATEQKPTHAGGTENKKSDNSSDNSSDGGQSGSNDSQGDQQSGGNSGSGSQQQNTLAKPTIYGVTPFTESTEVTMSGPEDAEIRYTTDGSTPTAQSTLYEGGFTLSDTTTVKAIAIKNGESSEVSTRLFSKGTGGDTGGSGDME